MIDRDGTPAGAIAPILQTVAEPVLSLAMTRADPEGSWPMRGWLAASHVVMVPETDPDEPVEVIALARQRTPRLLARLVDLSPRPHPTAGERELPETADPPDLTGLATVVGAPLGATARRWQLRWAAAGTDRIERLAVLDLPDHGLWELRADPARLRPTTPWRLWIRLSGLARA